jgi:hypothetical protein
VKKENNERSLLDRSAELLWEEQLKGLKEDQLRTQVLIPLFRAMGYQGLDHYHGTTERGKDIVMWLPTRTEGRENYAVVVKAGKINARASGKGSAGEVATQIQQCFGEDYVEDTRGEELVIHKVLVAASGTINKDAREAIHGILKNRSLERNVEFLPLEKLIRLLEKHLPQIGAVGLLEKAHAVISSANPELNLSVAVTPHGKAISVTPKDPNKPLDIKMNFQATSEEVAQELQQGFHKLRSEGSAFSVPAAVTVQLNLPALLESVGLGPVGSLTDVQISQRPREIGIFVFRRTQEDGTITELSNIHFQVVEAGTSKSKLRSNVFPDSAYELEFTVSLQTGEANLLLRPRFLESNAVAAYRAAAFCLALSKPGTLELVRESSGIALQGGSGTQELSFDPILVTILRRLAMIQEKTGVLLRPQAQYTNDHLTDIARTYIMVTEGKLTLASFAFTVPAEEIPTFSDKPDQWVFPGTGQDFKISLFASEINLGPSEVVAEKAILLIETDSSVKPGESKMVVRPEPGTEIFINFPRFSEKIYFKPEAGAKVGSQNK